MSDYKLVQLCYIITLISSSSEISHLLDVFTKARLCRIAEMWPYCHRLILVTLLQETSTILCAAPCVSLPLLRSRY